MLLLGKVIVNIVEVSLSEPHTNGTALEEACVCLRYVRVAIYQKFKLNEQLQKYTYILNYTHAKALQN